MRKTIVCQETVSSPSQALSVFDSGDGASVPIVLTPKDYGRPFQLFVNIPSGVYVLTQTWQKYDGMKGAGLIWFWLGNHRVSHIVTKSTITYNAPIRRVPTGDNVMVDIDLSLTFQIGPDDSAAYKFVYLLGAHRLDDLLMAETDEAIRGLVYAVPYKRIHDLRESFAQGTMRALNKKLNEYGVVVKSVKVTDVRLPKELSDTLENTTSFKTKMLEQEKKHENNMRVLNNNEKQKFTAIQKHNERLQQDLRAKTERGLIERGEEKAKALAHMSVSKTDCESRACVQIAQAKSNKAVAEAQGQRQMAEIIGKAKMESEARIVEADQMAREMILASEAKIEAAKAEAGAITEKARVEGDHAEDYASFRQFQYDLQRMEVMRKLATSGNIVVSGNLGNQVLENICPGSEQDREAGGMIKSKSARKKTRLLSEDAADP